MTFSTGKKLFLSHFLAIILVSGSIGTYFYQNAIDNLLESVQARLKYSAALLGSSVDASDFDQIKSPADKNLESYQKGVAQLRELVKIAAGFPGGAEYLCALVRRMSTAVVEQEDSGSLPAARGLAPADINREHLH